MTLFQNITPLASLDNTQKRPHIIGRVLKIWNVTLGAIQKPVTVNFVLLDNKNTPIEGSVAFDDFEEISKNMREGRIFEFHRFRVVPTSSIYKTIDHKWQIRLTDTANIIPASEKYSQISQSYFNFRNFEDIGTTLQTENFSIDVIGYITQIYPIKTVGHQKETKLQTIQIANEKNIPIQVTIWEEDFDKLDIQLIKNEAHRKSYVLAFSSVRLRKFEGTSKMGTWGLKTYAATRIYEEQNMPQIVHFLNSMKQAPINLIVHEEQGEPRIMTIKQLLQLDQNKELNEKNLYKCSVIIEDILDEYKWYYLACHVHKKKLQEYEDYLQCPTCHNTYDRSEAMPWLKICLSAADDSGSADFVALGTTAETLINKTTDELLNTPKKKKGQLPQELIELAGKKFTLTVHYNPHPIHPPHPSFTIVQSQPHNLTTIPITNLLQKA